MEGDIKPYNVDFEFFKERFEKIISEDQSSDKFVLLAELFRKEGNEDRAIELLLKGLRHNPDLVTARLLLGRIYSERWMIDQATKEMEEIIRVSPDNIEASKFLVQVYRSEGKLERALEVCITCYIFNPHDEQLMKFIQDINKEISLLEEVKKKPLSMENINSEPSQILGVEDESSLSDSSYCAEVYTETMADLYSNQAEYGSTIKIFEKLLEDQPDNVSLKTKLAKARALFLSEKAGFKTKPETG